MVQKVIVLVCIGSLTTAVSAVESDLDTLKAACAQAREQRLAPERNKLIAECIDQGKKEDYCQRYYQDYGAGGKTAGGGRRAPLYFELPECQALDKAERSR